MTAEDFKGRLGKVDEVKASSLSPGQVRVTILGSNGMTVTLWTNVASAPKVGDVFEITLNWVEAGT